MLYPNLWLNLILAVTDNVASLKEISLLSHTKKYIFKEISFSSEKKLQSKEAMKKENEILSPHLAQWEY